MFDPQILRHREGCHELAGQPREILRGSLAGAGLDPTAGRIEHDDADPDDQTLLLWWKRLGLVVRVRR